MASYAQWGNELYSGKRSYNIVGRSTMFLGFGGLVVVLALVLLLFRGINPSIEFSGGTQFIVSGASQANQQVAYDVMSEQGIRENVRVSQLGQDSIRIQTVSLETAKTVEVRAALAEAYDVSPDDIQTNSVGATWSQDVQRQAIKSIVIFVVLVTFIMAAYFRSWSMSAAALIALANDLLLTIGFFALTQVEVSPATVIGFLTILGYSLYDTVVVFDKIREVTHGFQDQNRYTYSDLVNLGVNQTLVRSINTSVVALLPVASILFIGSLLLGAGTLTDISLALFVGMLAGTYSSIFIAAPALAVIEGSRQRTKKKDEVVLARRELSKQPGEATKGGVKNMIVPVAATTPGKHLGQSAQPKRSKGKK